MRKIVLLSLLLAAGLAASATEASAVVCAKGVNGAGCAGTRGAVAGRRTYGRTGALARNTRGHYYGGPRVSVHRRTTVRHY